MDSLLREMGGRLTWISRDYVETEPYPNRLIDVFRRILVGRPAVDRPDTAYKQFLFLSFTSTATLTVASLSGCVQSAVYGPVPCRPASPPRRFHFVVAT